MGRYYSVSFSGVAVSAIQDLFEIKAAAGKPVTLHEVVIEQSSDYGDSAAEGLGIVIKRGTGAITGGSGGSGAVTPAKHNTSDAAASALAETNNTTQAVAGGGTITTIRAEAFNVQAGWQYLPLREDRIIFLAAEYCIVSLTGAPADALTMSGTLVFEED